MTLPPGFRFHPNDDELVGYYLKRKVDGLKIELEVIPVVDLYKHDPWELPEKSFLPKRDMEWFFFCPRDRKYPNGSRTNRATCSGYWKATGKDRKVICESTVFGLRKTLVFYRGRAPGGQRTDWIMHEYRLCENFSQGPINFVGAFALCRIVKRTENVRKNGDLHEGSKAKMMHHSSSMPNLNYRECSGKLTDGREESSSVGTNRFNESSNSTSTSSPQTEQGTELQPTTLDNDDRTFCGHQVADFSKASSMDNNASMPSSVFSGIANSSWPFNPCENYAEEAFLVDECNGNDFFSSFLTPTLGMYGNAEDITFPSLEFQPPKHNNASYSAFESANYATSPLLCRQISEGEEANLWVQEDNFMIAI